MKRVLSLIFALLLAVSLPSCVKIELIEPPSCVGFEVQSELTVEDEYASLGKHTHFFDSPDGDCIKLVKCAFDGCWVYGRYMNDGADGVFDDYLNSEDKWREITSFCNTFLNELRTVERYDPELHAFSEDSPLFDASRGAVEKMKKLDDYAEFVSDLEDVMYFHFRVDAKAYDKAYREAESFSVLFTEKYSKIEVAAYNSAYREYLFRADDGWDEEKLEAEIASAKASSDEATADIARRINATSRLIELIKDPMSSEDTPRLLSRLVNANNEFAKSYGYDNYFEYAQSNVYGRDYQTDTIDLFISYVKKYITPLLWNYQNRMNGGFEISNYFLVNSVFAGSVRDDRDCADAIYAFLKKMESAGGPVSYYESANNALKEGRLRVVKGGGDYLTAFTHYIAGLSMPMMCFSEDYLKVDSFIHEHGHYYAYLTDSSDQVSYDVNETQSQGAEFLYLDFLSEYLSSLGVEGYKYVETQTLYSNIISIINCACCTEFEKVLYTGDIGSLTDPEGRFADGITYDEYDYLYDRILSEYDIASGYERYWRITVPASPCYYISYSVSLIPSIEFFMLAKEKGFDAGARAYLSIFEFENTEEYENRDVCDVDYMCRIAGIGSPFEEDTFIKLYDTLISY